MQTILGVLKSKKGLSTLGSSKRITVEKTGKAWVGKNYKNIKDKSGNIIGYSSKDGMRAYRLQYKRKEEQWRANFTENYIYINRNGASTKKELKNVHIDILDN